MPAAETRRSPASAGALSIIVQAYANITPVRLGLPSTTSRTDRIGFPAGHAGLRARVRLPDGRPQIDQAEPGVNHRQSGSSWCSGTRSHVGAGETRRELFVDLEVVPVKPIRAAPRASQPVVYQRDDVVLGHEFLDVESESRWTRHPFHRREAARNGWVPARARRIRASYKYANQSATATWIKGAHRRRCVRAHRARAACVRLRDPRNVEPEAKLRWRMFAAFMAVTGGLAAPACAANRAAATHGVPRVKPGASASRWTTRHGRTRRRRLDAHHVTSAPVRARPAISYMSSVDTPCAQEPTA